MSITSLARVKALAGVTTEVVTITPGIATQMLTHNTHNRGFREAKIRAYARDMAMGAWQFDASPLRFGKSGTLLDGQNRLAAVVRPGATVQFLVVRGLSDASQEVMDTGTKRTASDQLHLRDVPYAHLVAAIARRAAMWDQGQRSSGGGGYQPSESEIRAFVDNNPLIHPAAEIASRTRKAIPLAPSTTGLAVFLCLRVDPEDVQRFYIDQLTERIESSPAARALMRKFDEVRDRDKRGRSGDAAELFAYVLKAWNLYRGSRSVSALRPPTGGWTGRNLPEPI